MTTGEVHWFVSGCVANVVCASAVRKSGSDTVRRHVLPDVRQLFDCKARRGFGSTFVGFDSCSALWLDMCSSKWFVRGSVFGFVNCSSQVSFLFADMVD